MKRSFFTSLSALVIAASPLSAQIIVDSGNLSTFAGEIDSMSAQTLSHTVAAGSNQVLVVTYGARNADANLASISFNGDSLTNARFEVIDINSGISAAGVWYLPNPDVGTFDISYTMSDDDDDGVVVNAFTLSGVDTSNPLGQTGADSGVQPGSNQPVDMSVSLTGLSTDSLLITSAAGGWQGTLTPTNVDSELFNGLGKNVIAAAGTTSVDSASETIDYSFLPGFPSDTQRSAMVTTEFLAIPEPSSVALLIGSLGLFFLGRRRRHS